MKYFIIVRKRHMQLLIVESTIDNSAGTADKEELGKPMIYSLGCGVTDTIERRGS